MASLISSPSKIQQAILHYIITVARGNPCSNLLEAGEVMTSPKGISLMLNCLGWNLNLSIPFPALIEAAKTYAATRNRYLKSRKRQLKFLRRMVRKAGLGTLTLRRHTESKRNRVEC